MKVIKLVIALAAIGIISLLLTTKGQAQTKTNFTSMIDLVIEKAKSTALNARGVNWDSVKSEMYFTMQNTNSISDLRPSFETLLVALKDKNGKFFDPTSNTIIAQYPYDKGHVYVSTSELAAVKQTEFQYQHIAENIHYIRLTSNFNQSEMQKNAELIRQAVDSLSKEDQPYWIVDLRHVVDGDLNSLFAGVGPLLGEGLVFSSIDGHKQIRNLYTVHNGNFYNNQVRVGKFATATHATNTIKVAVLTSRYTSGAGEILALAFKGRRDTRVFGEETAGRMISPSVIPISNNLSMSLAEVMYTDRKGTTYTGSVSPHTVVDFVPGQVLTSDKAIQEATLWLTATPVTASSTKVTMK